MFYDCRLRWPSCQKSSRMPPEGHDLGRQHRRRRAARSPHPLRAAILNEVHARPFTPIETPRRVLHFAFDTAGEAGRADRAALADFCASRGLDPLKAGRQAPSRRARRRHLALGAALRIYHLYLGAAVGDRHAVPSGGRVAGGAHGGRCRSRGHCWSRSTCICWPNRRKNLRSRNYSTAPAWRWRRIPTATRCSPPISRPIRQASCASWCSTAAWARSAPARWCSASSSWRPIARWRCSACRRRSG